MKYAFALMAALVAVGVCLGAGPGQLGGHGNGGGPAVPDGTTTICTWQDGRLGAISLTHDDDRWDHINYFAPALTARGLRGTFNVNPGVSVWPAMQASYAAIAQHGHELASHTMLHQRCIIKTPDDDPENGYFHSMNELAQDCQAVISILSEMQARPVTTFAYPYGAFEWPTTYLLQEYFLSARDSGMGALYVNAASPWNLMVLHGSPVGNAAGLQWNDYQYAHDTLTSYIQGAVSLGGWVIEEYHSLLAPEYSALDPQAYYDHLDDLVAASTSGRLWVAPQGDVARYITSRDMTQVSLVGVGFEKIEVQAFNGLNRDVYDVPLTLRTKLPATWADSFVKVIHAGDLIAARFEHAADGDYVVYSVLPDNAVVTISCKPAPAHPQGPLHGRLPPP